MQKSTTSILILSFLLCAIEGKSTDTTKTLRNKTFKVTVHTNKTIKGFAENISDSVVLVSPRPVKFNPYSSGDFAGSHVINYSEIRKIEIRRKGSVGRGALIGGISAMLAGVLTGFIEGDDKVLPASEDPWQLSAIFRSTAGDKAVVYGLTGLVTGGIVGAIIGALSHKKYIINGNKDKYDDMRKNILNKAYRVIQNSY